MCVCVCIYAPQTVHAAKQLKSFLCLKLPALFLPDVLFFSMTVHRCIFFDGIWLRMYPATMVCHESRVLFSIELYVQQQLFFKIRSPRKRTSRTRHVMDFPSCYEDIIVTSILRFGLKLM